LADGPVLMSASPTVLPAGGPATTITAFGSGFTSSNVLIFNVATMRLQLATTFVSATRLTGVVPASALTAIATAMLSVTDPPTGGNSASLTVRVDLPEPFSLSRISASAGDPGFTLRVTGSNFAPGAVVLWNQIDL